MNEGERMEGGRRNQTKNLMPVSARMILQHHEEEGPLQVCGVEVGMVVMVVQIRQVVKGDTSISYMVEDDTGRMEAVHYHDERTIPAMKNTFVKIVGVLKTGGEEHCERDRVQAVHHHRHGRSDSSPAGAGGDPPPYHEAARDGCGHSSC